MLELLRHYSITDILIFIVILAVAIKGTISFFEWAKQQIDKDYKPKKEIEMQSLKDGYENNRQAICNIQGTLETMQSQLQLLIDSDRDDIKSFITREHHYFMHKGFIDDFSLDCMEKRYAHYLKEHGNSFVEHLMEEVRELPRKN